MGGLGARNVGHNLPSEPIVVVGILKRISGGTMWKTIQSQGTNVEIVFYPRWRSRNFWTNVLVLLFFGAAFLLGACYARPR